MQPSRWRQFKGIYSDRREEKEGEGGSLAATMADLWARDFRENDLIPYFKLITERGRITIEYFSDLSPKSDIL